MALATEGGNHRQGAKYSRGRKLRVAACRCRCGDCQERSLCRRWRRHQVSAGRTPASDLFHLNETNPKHSPLISILSHLSNNSFQTPHHPTNIHFLYSSRLPPGPSETSSSEETLNQILFLPRLRQIIRSQLHSHRLRISLDLFLTDLASSSPLLTSSAGHLADLTIHSRRISEHDLRSAVVGGDGKLDPRETVCYVCGPPQMTDQMVQLLGPFLGEGAEKRVLFEKWW